MQLPCIACGKEFKPAMPGTEEENLNQPYGGTIFFAPGQYGSTVFDPVYKPEELEINVCDECLVAHAHRSGVLHRNKVTEETHLWKGDEE